MLSRELSRRRPLGLTFDAVPVVLFRDAAGRPRALVDRCPHRSVKLSLGTRTATGELQCAFHGWRFDGDGRCLHIPLAPGAETRPGAQALACREIGGMIWLFGGDDADAHEPITPASLSEPGWFGAAMTRDWSAHWSRALQTMLDVAHIPFVHPRTIGVAFGRAMGGGEARLGFEMDRREDGGFRADWRLEDPASGKADQGWLEFLPPNGMTLGIPQKAAGAQSMLHIWCVPLSECSSRMIVVSRRNFGRYNPLLPLFDLLTPVILAEDRRRVESMWPSEVPAAGVEASSPADSPTVAFQRWYRQRFRPVLQTTQGSSPANFDARPSSSETLSALNPGA